MNKAESADLSLPELDLKVTHTQLLALSSQGVQARRDQGRKRCSERA